MINYAYESLDKTQDNENFIPQPSCSYEAREGPKDQSRACHGPIEVYNNEQEMYSMSPASQLGTGNCSRSETIYLTLQRRQVPGLNQVRSLQETSRDDDFRQDNTNVDWEGCKIFDSEGSSCVAPECKDGEELSRVRRKRIEKEEENIQAKDCPTLDEELSIMRDSLGVERQSPMLSMDARMFISPIGGGSCSGPESHLKEMITQQKRRILINTRSRASSDLNQERISFLYGSPERCWISKTQSKNGQQDDESPSTHASGLPRGTSSRNLIGCGSALYRSPSRATPVETQIDVKRKACNGRSNENSGASLGNFNEDDNEHHKVSSARIEQEETQRPLQENTEYDQASLAFDSKFLKRLSKINGGVHTDHDERVAQSSMALDLAEPPSPTVNVELKRKVEELERLVADERKKFQVVTE